MKYWAMPAAHCNHVNLTQILILYITLLIKNVLKWYCGSASSSVTVMIPIQCHNFLQLHILNLSRKVASNVLVSSSISFTWLFCNIFELFNSFPFLADLLCNVIYSCFAFGFTKLLLGSSSFISCYVLSSRSITSSVSSIPSISF